MHSIDNRGGFQNWAHPRYALGPARPQYGWGPRWGVPETVVYNVDPVPAPVQYVQQPVQYVQQPVQYAQQPVQYVQQPAWHRSVYSDDYCCNPSFTTLVLLACLVMWCCGFIFGLIAFILAVSGRDRAHLGDGAEAHRLARASLWVSIAGIVVAVVIVVVTASVSMTNQHTTPSGSG